MKLASITINYNNGYKLKEWRKWYDEYKDSIGLHIIVDNGSQPDELELVEKTFPDSHIIKLGFNGGCTIAYSAGIRYALKQPDITHIALIGSDLRLEKEALIKCVELLESDPELGMVAPVLLNADSDVVADFGDIIADNLSLVEYGKGKHLKDIPVKWRYCEAVTGGMNVSKRSFYETTVGLQDEKLFMYSDEVDMGLRARKAGVKLAVTKEAVSWHQHINPPGLKARHPFSNYLIARNKVYLGKKHFGRVKQLKIFNKFFFQNLILYIKLLLTWKHNMLVYPRWAMIGAWNGLIGNMKENKYSKL